MEDFEWIQGIEDRDPTKEFRVGDIIDVPGARRQSLTNPSEMMLKVIDVTNEDVFYEVIVSDSTGEPVGDRGMVTIGEGQGLYKTGYWDYMYNEKEGVNESADFQWIKDEDPTPLNGLQFVTSRERWDSPKYIIIDNGGKYVTVTWKNDRGGFSETPYEREDVEHYFNDGSWIIIEKLNESDDFGWIADQNPSYLPETIWEIPEGSMYYVKYGKGEYQKEYRIVFIKAERLPTGEGFARFEDLDGMTHSGWDDDGKFIITENRWARWVRINKVSNHPRLNESADFEWINDVPEPLVVKKHTPIKIVLCNTDYGLSDLIDKIKELYPDEPVDMHIRGLSDEIYKPGIILYLEGPDNTDGYSFIEWDECSAIDNYTKYDYILEFDDFMRVQWGDTITESDDFQWIADTKPAIELRPKTLYYFKPNASVEEITEFANRISNSDRVKEWFFKLIETRYLNDLLEQGMKFFYIDENLEDKPGGWCTNFALYQDSRKKVKTYPELRYVDARKEFNL